MDGIDYSLDYNNQELPFKFIYSEIIIALSIQKTGGTFILKVFDLLNYSTIQLIYLLYCSYKTIYIMKPFTSRNTNLKKYLICIDYKINKNIIKLLIENYNNNNMKIYVPKSFISNINIYNSIYIDKQRTNILNTISNIEKSINYINPTKYKYKKWN